ncbi:MAG TPA: DUF6230 family protein [Bacillales bacterium]|nr:DUF6230 family protein [Bacillales bacterium]
MEPLYQEQAVEEESEIVTGRTVKKKLMAALLSGFLLLGGLAAVFGISGVAYAMPIAGIGNFHVEFSKLTGSGFKLFTKIGDTGKAEQVPMFRVKIDEATIHDLHIYKIIEVPGMGKVKFNITASEPVQVKGLIQDAQEQLGNATFKNQAIDENFGADHPFSQTADSITLTDASLVTDYLFQSVVTLNGLHLGFENIEG